MTVKLASIVPADWKPEQWHSASGSNRRWRVDSTGIYLPGSKPEGELIKSKGQLASAVFSRLGEHIVFACDALGVSRRLVLATLCIESGGTMSAQRFEAHLNDYSFGLAQTLTNTALSIGRVYGFPTESVAPSIADFATMPDKSIPQGGDVAAWKRYLFQPLISVSLCAAYHHYMNKNFHLQSDPVLQYVTYNAGSPRETDKNPWGLVHVVPALDTFCAYYEQACRVIPDADAR